MNQTIELPYNFNPSARRFQSEVWNDPRKNKVLVLHRRSGKTSLALNKLILEAICNQNKVYYYICPTQKQAKEIAWKAPDMLSRYLPEQAVSKKNEVELTIYFHNGSQIHVKGADSPDTLRGVNPHGVILDEYAQMKPAIYDEVLKPILDVNGGWVWFVGTPASKNDFYRKYKMAQENPSQWQVVHLKASQSNIIPRETLDEIRRTSTQNTFNQEFEVEFLEGEGQVFRRIRENVRGMLEEPRAKHMYQMGVDLAKYQDWTVITVVNRHTHGVVYWDRFNQIDWNLQKARIEAVARRYNNCPMYIDSTGVGDPIAEDLRRIGLIVNDIKFTNENKKNLIENLATLIEQNKISYPDLPELLNELADFTYEIGATGTIKYHAPEGLHDDAVISCALAYWHIGEKLVPQNNSTPNYGFSFSLQQNKGYNKPIFMQK